MCVCANNERGGSGWVSTSVSASVSARVNVTVNVSLSAQSAVTRKIFFFFSNAKPNGNGQLTGDGWQLVATPHL